MKNYVDVNLENYEDLCKVFENENAIEAREFYELHKEEFDVLNYLAVEPRGFVCFIINTL